jgi:septal ring factor EnvC (AmiA/AmiB activator)
MAYLRLSGLGETREYTLEELQRKCEAGDSYACTLAASRRQSGSQSSTTSAEAAAERERQAVAQRNAEANRAADAGVNPSLVQAVRTAQDVQYRKTGAFGTVGSKTAPQTTSSFSLGMVGVVGVVSVLALLMVRK